MKAIHQLPAAPLRAPLEPVHFYLILALFGGVVVVLESLNPLQINNLKAFGRWLEEYFKRRIFNDGKWWFLRFFGFVAFSLHRAAMAGIMLHPSCLAILFQ